jgi:hypothetical protein
MFHSRPSERSASRAKFDRPGVDEPQPLLVMPGKHASKTCDVCGKIVRSDNLTRHLRSHSGASPHMIIVPEAPAEPPEAPEPILFTGEKKRCKPRTDYWVCVWNEPDSDIFGGVLEIPYNY